MRTWTWDDEVYRTTFYLVEGSRDDFSSFIKQTFDHDYKVTGSAHTFFTKQHNAIAIWVQPREWDVEHISVIAHEAFHATTFALDTVGIRLADESDEAFAYYLAWVVRNVLTRLAGDPKKPKRKAA